jgi:hypothetical protein
MTRSLPAALLALAEGQSGLVSARQAEEHDLAAPVRRRLCLSGTWSRVCRGVFDVDPTKPRGWPERRRRTALTGLLRHGPKAAAVGVTALALLGAEGLPMTDTSQVAIYGAQGRRLPAPAARPPVGSIPETSSRDADGSVSVVVRQFDAGMRTVVAGGFRIAAPEWALAQAVPELPHRNAVAVMDSMLRRRLITAQGLERAHALARGRRGVARTHQWWSEADGRAESPLESFGRVDCIEHEVPPDDLQVEILGNDGILLGRGDMGWRLDGGIWLLAELDGREYHEKPEALLHDRSRQNLLLLHGEARLLRFTSREAAVPGVIARTVRRALETWAPGRTTTLG